MSRDLETVLARCDRARKALLESMTALDRDGPRLREALRQHADRYIQDETRGRAIREQARQIGDELMRSQSAEANLAERTAMRVIEGRRALVAAVSDQAATILADAFAGNEPDPASKIDPEVAVEIVAVAEAIIIAQAYEASAGMIDLYRQTLEDFVGEHVQVSGKTVLDALKKRLGDKGDATLVELAASVAEKIGAELMWFVKLADEWRKLKQAVEEQIYRGAGPEDSLLDLVQDLRDRNNAMEACAAAI